ncbi:endonuclease/exonuclease/phosphatase, partial [Streptomyces sp. NRRL F-6602]
VQDGGLVRESAKPGRDDELSVATYNVENLDPGDPQEKFDALARAVVTNLASPDVLAMEEIQDDNGPTDDGTVSADETLRRFTEAITAAGGPRYDWRGIDPVDKADGGEPGGNIRQAFLFNPARVSFTDRPGGDATTATGVVRERGGAALTHS